MSIYDDAIEALLTAMPTPRATFRLASILSYNRDDGTYPGFVESSVVVDAGSGPGPIPVTQTVASLLLAYTPEEAVGLRVRISYMDGVPVIDDILGRLKA